MRERNDECENVMDAAMTFDLATVINLTQHFFREENEPVCDVGMETQIDLLINRRCHLKSVINCKVINGEANGAIRENQNRQQQ